MVTDNCSSRSLRVLGTFFKEEPAYAFYGRGKHGSSRNVVSLLTNSIRVEIQSTLRLLKTIADKPHLLTRDMVADVYAWLEDSVKYMDISFEALLHEIMNKIGTKVSDMGPLAARKRVLLIGSAQRSLQRMLETELKFQVCLPPGEVFSALASAAGELRSVVHLLGVIDKTVPGFVREALSVKEVKKLEKHVLEFLVANVGEEAVEGTMTRWMTEKQTRYMAYRRGLVLSKRRVLRARVKCAKEHGKLPAEIGAMLREEEKLQLADQEVMNPEVQRMLNSTASLRLSKRFGSYAAVNEWSDEEWESEQEEFESQVLYRVEVTGQ